MDFIDFTAGNDDAGRRLDHVLARIFHAYGGSGHQAALRKRLVRLNRAEASPAYRVQPGDTVSVAAFLLRPEADRAETTPQPPLPETIFRNGHLWIMNKPAGVNVQPARRGAPSLAGAVAADYRAAHPAGASLSFLPAPLHRLDQYTTGLLAFSQSIEGARWFSQALRERAVRKTYTGIVSGALEIPQRWTDSLTAASPRRGPGYHTVAVGPDGAARAETSVRPLARGIYAGRPVTLAQFDIGTGRKHQIRAQSAYHGFPLLGDCAYGGSLSGSPAHYLLHAAVLRVPQDNPVGLPPELRAPLPSPFVHFLTRALIKWDGSLIM